MHVSLSQVSQWSWWLCWCCSAGRGERRGIHFRSWKVCCSTHTTICFRAYYKHNDKFISHEKVNIDHESRNAQQAAMQWQEWIRNNDSALCTHSNVIVNMNSVVVLRLIWKRPVIHDKLAIRLLLCYFALGRHLWQLRWKKETLLH